MTLRRHFPPVAPLTPPIGHHPFRKSAPVWEDVLRAGRMKTKIAFKNLLFPSSHFLTQEHKRNLKPPKKKCTCKSCAMVDEAQDRKLLEDPSECATPCKWKSKHWKFMEEHDLNPKKVENLSTKHMSVFCRTPRVRHMIAAWRAKCGVDVINTSQSVERCSATGRGATQQKHNRVHNQ